MKKARRKRAEPLPLIEHEALLKILHYDPETGLFTWKITKPGRHCQVGKVAHGCPQSDGYLQIGVEGKKYLLQRLAWFHFYGEWPKGTVDHEDRVKTNNAIRNLRDLPQLDNCKNQGPRKHNKLGLKGVTEPRPGRFRAVFTTKAGKTKIIGTFDTAIEAAIAHNEAARKEHGDLAYQNPIPQLV